jgi:hypothetical protein
MVLGILLPALAQADMTQAALTQARQLQLGADPFWHVLLYYQPAGSGYVSAATQPEFFLSAQGRTSPDTELNTTLERWLAETNPAPGSSVRCHFPARIAWLREHLHISPEDHADASCPALEAWLTGINPSTATLVFASAYLNNPSSMFGHTLLRIDTPDSTASAPLLAYTINYAAETRETNGIVFAVKGLSGGYPGGFSVLPYYEKIKEYNDFENRDLWEYQLTLSPAEVRRLLQHLWELRGITFPYYFFSDNCSYELLSLLESARPGLTLHQHFPVYAIPVDTVRVVLAEPGLLKAVVYRPSSATRLSHEIERNSAAVNQAASRLMSEPAAATPGFSPEQRAQAQETAYDDLYYRFLDHAAPLATTPPLLRGLLVARSQTAVPDQRTTPPQPAVDPAHGHATSRVSVDMGDDAGRGFVGLDLRPAYHDLLDPPGGYVAGARIDFLDTGLRYTPETGQVRLEHFTLFAIDSLSPRNAFLKPLSWNGAMGVRETALDADGHFSRRERHNLTYGEAGAGISLNAGKNLLCYGQLQVNLEAGPALDRGWRAGAGPRLGCLAAGERSQWQLEAGSLYRRDQHVWESRALLGWQFQPVPEQAVRLTLSLAAENSLNAAQADLAWLHYF